MMCVFGRVLSFPSKMVVDGIWTVVLTGYSLQKKHHESMLQ